MIKVCILGLGYIGLPTAVILARNHYRVVGVDINKQVVETINQGQMHITEPGLSHDLKLAVEKGNIRCSGSPEPADIFIIAVPTPTKEDMSCDLSAVIAAARSIVPSIKKNDLIIIESTIPPGTTDEVVKPILEGSGFTAGVDISLAHCPERVLPGNIVREIVENNRVVGGCTPQCTERAAAFYERFTKGKILKTDARTAEMTKLVENTFRDVNIAFVNELAKICASLKIDVFEVIRLANEHPRVNLLKPGPGVGGHCLAVDPYFIVEKAPELAKLISCARETNSGMPSYVVEKAKSHLRTVPKPRVAIFGTAYKGNIDDTRESPALKVLELLQNEGCDLAVYDPYVKKNGPFQTETPEKAVENADLLLILTDHDPFKVLDYPLLAKRMRNPVIFDTRGILSGTGFPSGVTLIHYGNV